MTMLALLASVTYADTYTDTESGLTYTYQKNGTTASVKLYDFTRTSVTIPATVIINKKEYQVTAIDEYGFCKKVEWWQDLYTKDILTYDDNDNTYYIDGSNYNNTVLQSVTFDQPSNITTIGNYAFNSSSCFAVTKFLLSLSFKLWVGYFDTYNCCQTFSYIFT